MLLIAVLLSDGADEPQHDWQGRDASAATACTPTPAGLPYHQAAPQHTITCCLISLALQMSPKAGAAMAAAEEMGQNYQIM